MHPLDIIERRIDAVITARDYCKPGSWGDNYWGGVLAYLLRQLNNYTNQPGYKSCSESKRNMH